MFAVIRTGGKQYRVAKDDKIIVEKLAGEPGAMVELSDVLMIGGVGEKMTVGAPVIEKAAVFAEVVEQSRANKILVFKKNRRKNYRRTRGHRQEQTVLRIVDVSPSGTKPKASTTKSKPEKINVTKSADGNSDKKVQAKTTATKSDKKIVTKAKTTAKEKSSVKKIAKKNPKSKE
jgi:large subunit ribosomal protein L21